MASQNDQKIAEQLWDDHGVAIYRFALRLSGNRTVAEDLTGETILGALEVLRKGKVEINRNYLFGITLNRWRKVRRVRTEPIEDLVAPDSPNRDALIDLERAFRKLSRPLQMAFILVKGEGLTYKEAALILNIPQGTVQGRVSEAIQAMRVRLGEKPSTLPILQEVKP